MSTVLSMSDFDFKNLNKPLNSRKDIVKVTISTKVSQKLAISIEMPSHSKRILRTYEKRTRSQSKEAINSVQAVNALFAENLKKRLIGKRKKPKLKINELPPRVTSYLTDESLVKPDFDDTFDRLRKGTVFIKVQKEEESPLVTSSDNDFSRLKKSEVHSTKSNSSKKVNDSSVFSPIMTRKRVKQRLITSISSTDQTKSTGAIVDSKTKSSDKMPSLYIEGETKKSYHFKYDSLSFIKIPNMRECEVFLDKRCDQIFSESFVERHTVASSTPRLQEVPKRKIVGQKISPIVKLHDLRSADLIQKSYEQIRNWDSTFPDVIKSFDTSDKENISKILKRRSKRKLSYVISPDSENIIRDPNLKKVPIVYVKPSDVLFKGFTEEEQKQFHAISENFKNNIDKQSKIMSRDKSLMERQINIEKKRIKDDLLRHTISSILKSPTKVNFTDCLLNEFELLSDGSIKNELNAKSITVNLKDFELFEANQSIINISDDHTVSNHSKLEACVSSPSDILHDHSYFNIELHHKGNLKESNENLEELNEDADSDGSASDCSECSECVEIQNQLTENPLVKPIILKAGKKYRRSLNLIRKTMALVQINEVEKHDENCSCWKCILKRKTINFRRSMSMVAIADENFSVLGNFARQSLGYVQEISSENSSLKEEQLDESVRNLSLNSSPLGKNLILSPSSSPRLSQGLTGKDIVLRRCGQIAPIPFEQCYSPSLLQHCRKIGEGVYGEVFLFRDPDGGTSVMKIMPIEGDLIVNGEHQKKFEEILSEIVIAMELSNLRNCEENKTTAFNEVKRVRCTQGSYPERLLDLWNLYDENGGSENDSPEMFQDNQLFIVLELSNGGEDLESFTFTNAQQAYSMLKQTACALAVAENQLKFEHRDLHWGNILLKNIRSTTKLDYYINGDKLTVDSKGIEVTIIDFTLSRVEFDDVVIFNDLSLDNELFAATGDYQFDIYRLMKKATGNKWRDYEPYTNILWLHYLLDKVPHLRYKNIHTKLHKDFLKSLLKLKDNILSFGSVTEFVEHNFV